MVCGSCQRPVCGEHLATSNPPECTECHSRRPEVREQAALRRDRYDYDYGYYYGYRDWLWYDQFQDDRLDYQGSEEGQLEDSGWDEVAAADFDDGDGGDFGDS